MSMAPRSVWPILLTLTLIVDATLGEVPQENSSDAHGEAEVSFRRNVAPILVKRCISCHGEKRAESEYRLDTIEHLLRAGDHDIAPVTPGDVDDSELYRLITAEDADERMPLGSDPLSDSEIELIRRWIEEGADFNEGEATRPLVEVMEQPPYPTPPESYAFPIPITALAFHPSGGKLFVSGHHEIMVWDPVAGNMVRRLQNIAQRTYALAFSPDAKWLAVAGGAPGRRGEVRLLNPSNMEEVRVLATCEGVVLDMAFHPDGQRLATAGEDRAIRIYGVESGAEELVIENHSDWVTAIDWSPSGEQLVSSSRDKTAKVYNSTSGELHVTYSKHRAVVLGVAYQPDGKQILSAGADNKIHVWNVDGAKKTGEITGYDGEVYKLLVSGDQLFSISADKTARQHKLENLELLNQFADQSDSVYSLAVHKKSRLLATGCFDGHVHIWNIDSGKSTVSFQAVPGKVTSNE